MSQRAERAWIVAAGVAAVLVVVAALAIAGVFEKNDPEPAADDFGSETTTEAPQAAAPTQPTVKKIPVGGSPDTISVGAGYVWVADSLAGTLQRIHPQSDRPVDVEAAGFPTDVSADRNAAWLALPDRGAVQAVTVRGPGNPVKVQGFPFQIAAGEGAAWAMSQKSVERVEASGSEGTVDGAPIALEGDGSAIAAGEGFVWMTRNNREVVRITAAGDSSAERTAEVRGAFSITVGESAVWVLAVGGQLTRLDPKSGEPAGDPVQTGRGTDVAAGLGYVWVTSENGTLIRIDPESGNEVGVPIRVGRQPQSVAVGESAVWVADAGGGAVYKVIP